MKQIRVLLIEDHFLARMALHSVLSGHPQIQIIGEAGDGELGISMYRQLRPDVVVLDLRLPDLDGWTVASRLRSNPRTQQIPVMITTAEPLTREQIAVLATEYDTMLLKPFEMATFLAVIERLLASQPSNRGTAPSAKTLQRCVGTGCQTPPDQPGS